LSHTQVQWARGTTAQVAAYTGPQGELVLNTDDWSLQAQDGVAAGGWVIRPRLNIRTVTVTGSQSVNITDDLIIWNPGTPAATTFNLPSSPRLGEMHAFKYLASSGSFSLTIAPPGGQTIDGAASVALGILYGLLRVVYVGSNQWVIA
jgi:major tropism determinant Mtd-like protein